MGVGFAVQRWQDEIAVVPHFPGDRKIACFINGKGRAK